MAFEPLPHRDPLTAQAIRHCPFLFRHTKDGDAIAPFVVDVK
jgi:hypothetical protein